MGVPLAGEAPQVEIPAEVIAPGVTTGDWLQAAAVLLAAIALAVALPDVLTNPVAGVLLQVRRPSHRGDRTQSGDHEGTVVDSDLRVVELRTDDGLHVLLQRAVLTLYRRAAAASTPREGPAVSGSA